MSIDLESTWWLFALPPSTYFQWQILFTPALFFVIFTFWLFPGGLAWALSKPLSPIRGPSGFPLLGNILTFSGDSAHRILAATARKLHASDLMAFSLGFTRVVISSNPDTAKEILGNSAFADRPVKESAYELLFHRAMGFAPYGEYWRKLRRISATHLFCPKRIAGFGLVRREIGRKMVNEIGFSMEKTGLVEVKRVLHLGSLNNVMLAVFGRCYDFDCDGDGVELRSLVMEGYELLGIFNWADHMPLLRWLDLQGVRRRCRRLVSRVNVFVGKIIEEHKMNRINGVGYDEGGDFVDVLLNLQDEDQLSKFDMIAVLWEMIFRGTDTVAILLEWILARMVVHPEIQSRAQLEIDNVVGQSMPVSDSHIPNLPYLQSIVKEGLRMHPPGPLLSWARLAIDDVHVKKNFVPAGTIAMVNMWAITHDEKIWKESSLFKPERFLEEDVSILGSDLRLAPFGSGRRVCPGKAMGLATVHVWLAQLLQSFKWLPSKPSPSASNTGKEIPVDLTETLRLSLEMKNPLVCKAVPRF